MTELISFGESGLDERRIIPAALERPDAGRRFVMLLEGEDDPEDGEPWPLVPGDRIVFASYEDEVHLAAKTWPKLSPGTRRLESHRFLASSVLSRIVRFI